MKPKPPPPADGQEHELERVGAEKMLRGIFDDWIAYKREVLHLEANHLDSQDVMLLLDPQDFNAYAVTHACADCVQRACTMYEASCVDGHTDSNECVGVVGTLFNQVLDGEKILAEIGALFVWAMQEIADARVQEQQKEPRRKSKRGSSVH